MLSSPQQCLRSLCLSRPLSESFHLPSGPLHHKWKMLSEWQTCLHQAKKMCVFTTEAGCFCGGARLGAASRPGCCLSRQSWEHPGQIILYISQSPFGRLPAALKPLQCSNNAGKKKKKNTEDPLLLKHQRDKVSNILLVGLTFLYEVLMKPGKCRALHTKRKNHINTAATYINVLWSSTDKRHYHPH